MHLGYHELRNMLIKFKEERQKRQAAGGGGGGDGAPRGGGGDYRDRDRGYGDRGYGSRSGYEYASISHFRFCVRGLLPLFRKRLLWTTSLTRVYLAAAAGEVGIERGRGRRAGGGTSCIRPRVACCIDIIVSCVSCAACKSAVTAIDKYARFSCVLAEALNGRSSRLELVCNFQAMQR